MAPTLRTRRDFVALAARRHRAAQLFARGHRQADVVRELRVSRETAAEIDFMLARLERATTLRAVRVAS